jgi:hypothetical protein
MGIASWMVLIVSALLTVGVVVGLVSYVVDLFRNNSHRPRRQRKNDKKKKHA